MGGTLRQSVAPSAPTVIGIAHVVLGAMSVFGVLIAVVFGSNGVPQPALFMMAIGAVAAVLQILGGLWLADRRRRGAVLSLGMDAVQCVGLALSGMLVSLSFILTLALGVAVIWVLPHLELPGPNTGD